MTEIRSPRTAGWLELLQTSPCSISDAISMQIGLHTRAYTFELKTPQISLSTIHKPHKSTPIWARKALRS